MIVMTYDTTLMVVRNPVNSPVEEKVVYPMIYMVSKTSQVRWFLPDFWTINSTIQQEQFFVGLGPASFGILGFAKGILSESQTTNSPLAVKKFAGNRCFNLTPEMGWKTLLQKMWGSWVEGKFVLKEIARGCWFPFSLPWKKIDGCFGGDGPWDSKLLTSQRKCWKFSQVQSGNTKQLVSQHPFSCPDFNFPAHDLERKFRKPCTFGTEDKKSFIPGVDNAAEKKQGPCSQKPSCCPQRKPSRRSPLKPRKKVPARLRCLEEGDIMS